MSDRTVAAILHLMGTIEMFALGRAFDGLRDEEYFWEPSQPCWSVRRRAQAVTPDPLGDGPWVLDFDRAVASSPSPSPVRTSIGWNIAHVASLPSDLATLDFLGGTRTPTDEYPPLIPGSARAARDMLVSGWRLLAERLAAADATALDREWDWAFGRTIGYGHLMLLLNEVSHHLAYAAALRDAYAARSQVSGPRDPDR